MKKQAVALLLSFAMLLTLAGCSAANAAHRLDAAEDRLERKFDAAEDSVERIVRKAVTPVPEATEDFTDTTVTQAQAENIALKYAGFTADQVTRLQTEYEIDDGIPQYHVEFHEGDWEYEFEISAKDGKILSYDKDHKFD
jgi:uncharacterized membrane protein YkoI